MFHKLDRAEALTYLDRRAAQGFTVIQAVILAELDGLRTPNAYGDLPLIDFDPRRPNQAYFQHVDFIINAAADRGLTIGLLPTWGDKIVSDHPGAGPLVFTPTNAATFGQFLGARYAESPIVWILGGDRDPNHAAAREIWQAMALAIKEATDGRQLMTYHPRGASTSARFFHQSDWLDFNVYQSGHQPGTSMISRLAQESIDHSPRKPFVDGEPAYEDIAIRFWKYVDFSRPGADRVPPGVLDRDALIRQPDHFAEGFINAAQVREQAYTNFFIGAAGYTYGNNAIWQMFERGEAPAIPALTDWRNALDRPGAQSIRHLHDLLTSRPFGRLRPSPELVLDPSPASARALPAALATDGSYAFIYLPESTPVIVNTGILPSVFLLTWWFNPRDGTVTRTVPIQQEGRLSFTPPSDRESTREDWVLVIDQSQADYPPPGQRPTL